MVSPFVALDRISALRALAELAHSRDDRAPLVYVSILEALNRSPNGGRSIRLPLKHGEPVLLAALSVRVGLLECVRPPRWVAVYQLTEEEQLINEVKVYSPDRPRKARTFHSSRGQRRHKLVSSHRIRKETANMAAPKTRTRKTRSAKKDPELDGLEELEELEELELDEEDEKPKRARRSRKAAAPDPEPEDDDEDDEDDDEEESEYEGMTLRQLRAAAKEAGIKSRGLDKDELIEALEADDEDDEDEPEEEPAPRKRTRKPAAKETAKKGTAKKQGSPVRELPKGKVGVERIAELAKTDGRTVRVFLRGEGTEKIDGRYAFTEKQAAALARKLKK